MNYRKIALKEKENIQYSSKNRLLDELLALRNLDTQEKIEKFLNPSKADFISPFAFLDIKKAVDRINLAIENNQKILIWGDFDCDGVTSTTILYKALNELKASVIKFIPDRLEHGHGLNSKELIKFVSKEKVKLVITVDCGISNIKEVSLLKSLGVDTIITDHHTTDIELPNAYAIINPQVKNAIDEKLSIDEIQSLTYNSGSIVAYKLAMALLENNSNQKLKDELLIIAGCGAIADVVPLLGENRAIVALTLEMLNKNKENSQKNIYRLLSKNIQDRDITSTDIGFILAPRINAVGRLSNAQLSFDFLNTTDDIKLDMIIQQLDDYNTIRQSKCAQTYEEVKAYLDKNPAELKNPAIILINPNWHVGVIGIVAAKVVENYNRPCFLMTVDENNNARCSIRSNDIINVYSVLKENEGLFLGFGGHKLAGGCSFNLDTTSFENVKESLLKTISDYIGDKKPDDTLMCDIELKSEDINLELLDTINSLEPFGQSNEPPLCAMFNVNLDEFKTIGKENNHLRMIFSSGDKKFQAVKWQETDLPPEQNVKCDIAFYPRLNDFNGTKSVQFEIIDIYNPDFKKNENNDFKIFDHRRKQGILEAIAGYFEREGIDVGVWAKTINTKNILSKYQKIKDNFIEIMTQHKGLMFFDYPSSLEELKNIINQIKPSKVHLMNCDIDENLENYVKQINGMIKYCANKLNGAIDVNKIAQTLCVTDSFVQLTLEILENIDSIEIIDVDKIKYLKPFSYNDFKNNSMFELLNEEFNNILEFKKSLLNCDIKEFSAMIGG